MSAAEDDIRTLTPEPDALGERLDRWLAAQCPDLSRSRCKALIEAGALSVDGAALTDPSAKLREGVYQLHVPAPEPASPRPEALPLDILFEDDHLIVVNKAAGMTVHPAAGAWTGTLVHALLHHCAGSLSGVGGVMRPGIVHRLDKDTSGVMVAAKSDAAHQGLSEQFAAHEAERAYIAFTRGAPKPRQGRIETRLGRSDHDRKKIAVLPEHSKAGKHAVTNYETLSVYGQVPGASVGTPVAARVACRLETGRTHQIRVHMAHIACPLLGDPLYGKGRGGVLAKLDDGKVFRDFSRQALHAAVLGFVHPVSGETLRFETDLPADMARLQGFLETL
ncbi:RluA family pseudouridine synthase [Alkalicaulis satelles]|uniref:Pseudouridine synthase n=1 Tax=Alkalicaulis satelles TaxID=2609175 RepID=A0A5M6ZHW7_9PROT|nr:RluA family pseudouridine synthase [Alkalicaulis satelles]KAA5803685.1 RluA family pseudouridine synthase [Alkalicaulis satelles]